MTYTESARTAARRLLGSLLAGALIVIAALAAARAGQRPAEAPSAAAHPERPYRQQPLQPALGVAPGNALRPVQGAAPGLADGVVPDGTTVFDDELPGVANLDPALLAALRLAAADAAGGGVELSVTSGWRSPAYQSQLLREAIVEYGSAEQAARWVASADTSPHVAGDAVDIAPFNAVAWLSEHGAGYGLCQIYGNEPWHYELRPSAIEHGCPAMYADPTHDPRMQR